MSQQFDYLKKVIDGIDKDFIAESAESMQNEKLNINEKHSFESGDFIEIKENPKKKSGNMFIGLSAVAAVLVCVVSVAAFAVTKGNEVSVTQSGGDYITHISQDEIIESEVDDNTILYESTVASGSDYTTAMDDTSVPEAENAYINGLVAERDNKIIARGFRSVFIYDSDFTGVLGEFAFDNGDRLDVIDDNIVVYAMNGSYIKLYDFYGNFIKEISPPVYDNGSYCLSDDGTQIAYSYQDTDSGTTYLYVDSIDFDNQKLIAEIPMNDVIDSIIGIRKILSFDGENLSIESILLKQTSPSLKVINGIAVADVNGNIENIMKLDEYEMLSTNYTNQKNYFVVTKGSSSYSNEGESGKTTVYKYDAGEIRTFVCEDFFNSFAYLSENGKYIAVIGNVNDSDKIIVNIYDFETSEKIVQREYNSVVFDVKFSQEESFAYIAAEGTIDKVSMK